MSAFDDLKAIGDNPKPPAPERREADHLSIARVTIPHLGFSQEVVVRRELSEVEQRIADWKARQ
jgi:hypothetical protein